jgi:murein DD-endopeptidase MepM/ murein hydrolase activator NlpD
MMLQYIMPLVFMLSLGGATIYVKDRRAMASQAAPAPAQAFASANTREQWAVALLAAVGNAQPTPAIIGAVVEWTIAEDGSDGALNRNNPWNTTMCGFHMVGSINADGACGVGHYATMEDGIRANAATLAQANFGDVTAALLANDAEAFREALWASPWAASHYGGGVGWPAYQAQASAPAAGRKCPYTDTMQIGAGSSFTSTGSGYWSGQYGGMHLGDDFIGTPGDPVYAPFDLVVESVGRYDDPGRFGANIQARFADGTLYYAGHLIDVYVTGGQQVPACTVIGTLGATAGPHTHIKLASPAAPVPCESSPPGEFGCIDPMDYWEAH